MNIIVKSLIGITTLGGIGGSSYALIKLLSKDDIGSKLLENGYILLTKDESNNTHWDNILKSYTEVAKLNNSLKFKDFDGTPVTTAKAKLQELCEKAINKKISEDDDKETVYKQAEKWCTIPQTVSQRLTHKGLKVLDTTIVDGKENQDKQEWVAKVKAYIATGNQNKITNPAWTGSTEPKKEGDAETKEFMKKCSELQNKKRYEKDYEQIFTDAERWCAIKK